MDEEKKEPSSGADLWESLAEIVRNARAIKSAAPKFKRALSDPEGRREALGLLMEFGAHVGKARVAALLREAADRLAQGGEAKQ